MGSRPPWIWRWVRIPLRERIWYPLKSLYWFISSRLCGLLYDHDLGYYRGTSVCHRCGRTFREPE